MPSDVENKLKAAAEKYAKRGKLKMKKGDSLEEAKNRYVYGTMNKLGLMKKK